MTTYQDLRDCNTRVRRLIRLEFVELIAGRLRAGRSMGNFLRPDASVPFGFNPRRLVRDAAIQALSG
jgi:hypothetical protein